MTNSNDPRGLDRREFLGAAAAAPMLGSAVCPAPRPASETIVVGVMGIHARGHVLAQDYARLPGVEVGFLCDVDARTFDRTVKALAPLQQRVPEQVRDFRRALDDTALDALIIAAPDHWHAPAAILACQAGKDVYVEKPCSHTPAEGEWLVAAAKKHGRIVQMGNQRRSWPDVIAAIEAAQTKIGRVYCGRAWYANARGKTGTRAKATAPDWLTWDLWQGPAPRREFTKSVVHYKWHWFWDWGTGELGNNGVHALDLCRWALGVDYPTRVVSSGGRYAFADDQETPDTQVTSWEFADGKQITWEGLSCNRQGVDGQGFGACILGTGGSVSIYAREWIRRDERGKEVERHPIVTADRPHHEDFLASIRTRRPPRSEILGGHQSTLLCHLGNIAQRTGRAIRCDPKNGHIREDRDAEKLWTREYADGFAPRVG